jgi:hypothetical protein
MTKYVSALFTFAAAVVAVYGDTHNPAKAGLARITRLGWIAAAVALVSFVVVMVQTRRDHAKINWETEQRSKVRRIANRQILAAVRHLLWPFNLVIREIWQKNVVTVDLDRLDKDATYMIELLSIPAVRGAFTLVDLRAQPNVYPTCFWWKFLAQHADEARELLNQAAAKYSGYLEPDALVAIEELRADQFLQVTLSGLSTLVSMNESIQPYTLKYTVDGPDGYALFDSMLTKGAKLLDLIRERRTAP